MRLATAPAGRTIASTVGGYLTSAIGSLIVYLQTIESGEGAFSWTTVATGAALAFLPALNSYLSLIARPPAEAAPQPAPPSDERRRPITLPPDPVVPDAPSYFLPAEFACKGMHCNCESPPTDPELLDVLNGVRERFGPVIINSGYRCPRANSEVGGAKDSYHMKSMAADIRVPGASTQEVYDYLNGLYPNRYGIAAYHSFNHVDVRRGSAARKPAPDQEWRRLPDIDLN